MPENSAEQQRTQPWLGTFVKIRVTGMPWAEAHRAIDAAFNAVSDVHRRMSFHLESSDVTRLNRGAFFKPVPVHADTFKVLQTALIFSAATHGCFDVSVGGDLVEAGVLPAPDPVQAGFEGCWRDIELRSDGTVAFHRPLWIDLGGIAKGFAVDEAISALRNAGAPAAVVNAGGDLRVLGPDAEMVALEVDTGGNVPLISVTDGSVASSKAGEHVHGRRRTLVRSHRFVCVAAPECMVADALTKLVMVEGSASDRTLRRFGASAHFHDPKTGWHHVNGECNGQ